MSTHAGPNIIEDGLVLALDAANSKSYPGSGTTWYDLSGNVNNIQLINSPEYSNYSINFNGINNYGINNQESSTSASIITVSVWLNPNLSGMNSYANVINKITGNSENGWSLERQVTTSNISWWVGDRTSGTSPWSNNNIIASMTSNTWQQFCGVFDGTNLLLYKNGILVSQKQSSMGILTGNEKITVGKHGTLNYFWKGNISNILIYNRSLSELEIKQNFNAMRGRYGI